MHPGVAPMFVFVLRQRVTVLYPDLQNLVKPVKGWGWIALAHDFPSFYEVLQKFVDDTT